MHGRADDVDAVTMGGQPADGVARPLRRARDGRRGRAVGLNGRTGHAGGDAVGPTGRGGQGGGGAGAPDHGEGGDPGECQAGRPCRGLATAVVGELLDEHCFLLAGSIARLARTGRRIRPRAWRTIGATLPNPLNGLNHLVRTSGSSAGRLTMGEWLPSSSMAVTPSRACASRRDQVGTTARSSRPRMYSYSVSGHSVYGAVSPHNAPPWRRSRAMAQSICSGVRSW